MRTRSFLLTLPFLLSCSLCFTDAAAAQLILHVDGAGGKAGAAGTKEAPLASLAEAVERINATRASENQVAEGEAAYVEPSVHLKIAPGIYREGGLNLMQRNSPLTLESTDPDGAVMVSGADVWTEWKEAYGVLSAPWPKDWGEAKFNGWPAGELKHLNAIGKRSELVFVNGQLLQQVEYKGSLRAGQYALDMKSKELKLRLPKGLSRKDARIEVSTRPHLLFAGPMPGLTLRNLVFTQACNGSQHSGLGNWAVLLAGEQDKGNKEHGSAPVSVDEDRAFIRNLKIENCRFEWNNGGGLTLANIIGVEVRNSVFSNNGTSGIGANRCKDMLYEDCHFDGNNWRVGKWGNAFGWAPAGTKHLFIDNGTFRRCTFNRNYATGLWMDFGNENILVEDCEIVDNWYVGFYFEASYGPCLVKDTRIQRNATSIRHDFATGGVLFAESKQLTLDNCIITDNANFQIGLRSRERKSSGYWSKTRFDGLCEHLTVTNSVIRGGFYAPSNTPEWFSDLHRVSTLIGASTHSDQEWYKKFIPTYKGDHNTFIQGFSTEVFSKGGNYGLDRVNLETWQKMTGQDTSSTFHINTPKDL